MTASTVKNSPMLDPDIRRLLDTVFAAPPGAPPPDVEALRAAAEEAPRRLGGEPEALGCVEDAQVPGPAGSIPLRIYRPDAASPLPLVLYAHGGGWVTGSLDSHDRLCRILARSLHAVLVAVGYRCAPEHVYPAALDDFEAAWRWARVRGASFGADGERFAVAGDSSGGNLAAALTLRLRTSRAPQPQLQLLLYPALDATCSRASYREFATGYNLAGAQMAWYWDVYRAGAAAEAPELSPLAARKLSGLAPAVVATAEADVLRDDGLDYARRLGEAGVPVRVIRCEGMIHGFLRWTGEVAAARRWIDAIAAATHEVLGPRAA
jgi:acetyl esterase